MRNICSSDVSCVGWLTYKQLDGVSPKANTVRKPHSCNLPTRRTGKQSQVSDMTFYYYSTMSQQQVSTGVIEILRNYPVLKDL